jgi:HEAT repeat protein
MQIARMSNRKLRRLAYWIGAGVLIVACLVVALSEPARIQEPVVNGRGMEDWLQAMIATQGASEEAKAATRAGGAAVAPYLAMRLTEGSISERKIEWKEKLPDFIQARTTRIAFTDWPSRIAAAQLLGEIGPAASNAVPALLEAMNKQEAMEWRGPRTPGGAYFSQSPRARVAAIDALSRIAAENPQVMDAIIRTLWNWMDAKTPIAVREATQNLPPDLSHLTPHILEGLRHRRTRFTTGGYDSLVYGQGYIADDEKRVLVIAGALTNAVAVIREKAAIELTTARISAPEKLKLALPALRRALGDPSEEVSMAAVEAIRDIDSAAVEPVTVALMRLLKSSDAFIRLRAVEVLRLMGADARKALPQLRERVVDEHSAVRVWAKKAIGEIEAEMDKEADRR